MNLDGLAAILAIARTSSLSGAAEHLGTSVSTVWRRLSALERDLGLRLVDRRPDGATLTRHGSTIAELAESVVDHTAQIVRTAVVLREGLAEPVRVSATEPLIAEILAPALPTLWMHHPELHVTLTVSNQLVSLARREADIAIRLAPPVGDSLVVRKLGAVRFGLYASRAYLGRRSADAVVLTRERLLVYDGSYGRLPELQWLEATGLWGTVQLRSSSTRALMQATRAGAGIGLLPAMFVDPRDELVELPMPSPVPRREMWIVVHRDLRRSPPIRAVHGWIQATVDAAIRRRSSAPAAGARGAHRPSRSQRRANQKPNAPSART